MPLDRSQDARSADVVFFDVGSTLLHPEPNVPEMFAQVARRQGYDLSVRDVEPGWAEADAFYEREYLRDGDFWCTHDRAIQIYLDMYELMARTVGIEDGARDLALAINEAYADPANWAVYPDVKATLDGLKRRGFALGVISNWDAKLEDLLRGARLLPYFDEVLSSAAVGCRKPNGAIFELACERMGVRPARAVHVGDNPEADGEGAHDAGIRPVIIDRTNNLEDCPYEHVSVLTDLVSLL